MKKIYIGLLCILFALNLYGCTNSKIDTPENVEMVLSSELGRFTDAKRSLGKGGNGMTVPLQSPWLALRCDSDGGWRVISCSSGDEINTVILEKINTVVICDSVIHSAKYSPSGQGTAVAKATSESVVLTFFDVGSGEKCGKAEIPHKSLPDKVSRNVNYIINDDVIIETIESRMRNSLKYEYIDRTNIVIPDGTTSIEPVEFSGCRDLTGVTVPDSVTSIGVGAFEDCSSLTEIVIPANVTEICNNTFSYAGLTKITIPESLTSIGERAFYHCEGLTDVYLPESITSIASNAFDGCDAVVFTVKRGSYAEKYATKNGFSCAYID